jgi:hypothetical protein
VEGKKMYWMKIGNYWVEIDNYCENWELLKITGNYWENWGNWELLGKLGIIGKIGNYRRKIGIAG